MLVIGTRCAYDRLTGEAVSWASMTDWRTKKDVITKPGNAKTAKTKDTPRTTAAAKRKVTVAAGHTRRSSGAMTQKMKDYKQSLAPDESDDEDDGEERVVEINDKNADPGGPKTESEGTVIPNVLPIPAFMASSQR